MSAPDAAAPLEDLRRRFARLVALQVLLLVLAALALAGFFVFHLAACLPLFAALLIAAAAAQVAFILAFRRG